MTVLSSSVVARLRVSIPRSTYRQQAQRVFYFSSSSSSNKIPFRPRRRSHPSYRPLKPRTVKPRGPLDPMGRNATDFKHPKLLNVDNFEDSFDGLVGDVIRHSQEKSHAHNVESQLRMMDYLTAEPGSTEDLVGQRRALMDLWKDEDPEVFEQSLNALIEEERIRGYELGQDDLDPVRDEDEEDSTDPNELAHGDWAESLIQVDRVQKVERGGTIVSYRSLMLGGNGKGVAGFGIGKALNPNEATNVASRMCRRNIYFVDPYQNSGLTRDLAGKHNSCKVLLRCTPSHWGLTGHDLIKEILTLLGVTNCTAKTHGNRNPYNVVRATFKAIQTHESMEEVALKRGKRLMNLERVKRMEMS